MTPLSTTLLRVITDEIGSYELPDGAIAAVHARVMIELAPLCDAAAQLAGLIECRVADGKAAHGGRHGMTPFSRARMEALEAALVAYHEASSL